MGSIPETVEMVNTVAENPISENGGCSFLTAPPKYKRRRVSAVRDFPPGCGPNAPQANRNNGNISICCTENTVLEKKKENGESADSDPSENCSSTKSADKPPFVSIKDEQQPNDSSSANSLSKWLQVETEFVVQESSNGTQNPSEDLTEVKQEIITEIKELDSVVTQEKIIVEEIKELDIVVEEIKELPYHPIPSTIDWKERSYPSRRRVSAIRDFPAGCGPHLPEKDHLHVDPVQAQPEPGKDELREENSKGDNEGEKHEQPKPVDDDVAIGKDCKETIVYRKDKGKRKRATIYPDNSSIEQAEKTVSSTQNEDLVIVFALMSANNNQLKALSSASPEKQSKPVADKRKKLKLIEDTNQVEKTTNQLKASSSASPATVKKRKKSVADKQKKLKLTENTDQVEKTTSSAQVQGEIVPYEEKNSPEEEKSNSSNIYDVSPPPFGTSSSTDRGARFKVRETLRLFQVILRKLLQEHETKLKEEKNSKSRIDLQAAKILKKKGKYVNTGAQIIGMVPGVEVGDEFHYRVELMMIGLHRQSQAGIDCAKVNGKVIATSIVASGGYDNAVDNSDLLVFSGQGGNVTDKDKKPEDQKLETRGNLGLKNSIDERNFVRVIHGVKETKTSEVEGRPKIVVTYTYDGLYTVERYWQELGQYGNKVYKFELKRIPNQSELAWKEVTNSKKDRLRKGRCVDDISEGKERFPISAINTIDNQKPPTFKYITRMMYPDWCNPIPLQGCNCTNGCSDSSSCPCVIKNGGEIPYNFDGAIVEAKPLVFECGPSCKCPNSCHNRVTQNGIRFLLEIFKTGARGWGVRSLSSIPSGSFICEYMGELLEDKEAEQRSNDEYLFDIGQEKDADVGFTIDAVEYGNVGRFINHSCSPNLYAQNVLYDHDDRRIPHVMLFAAENIPPLQELTYHYNYVIGQVYDRDGNVKVKDCYCGASDCTGRMY